MKTLPNQFWFVLFIFVISGFTGLIYESIWSHYLKLFLGHAAYAQALVLAIFMGGMAVGSWFIGKNSNRQPNLLKLYALAEGLIGFLGLIFHGVFTYILDLSYSTVFPNLPAEYIQIYKWGVGALLILPQSFLLGMTFPLMSGGLLRRFESNTGQTISLLYFCNSIGAAIGVIASGFILIKLVGLPGTILTAAIINIALAIIVYGISKGNNETIKPSTSSSLSKTSIPSIILIASLFTGMASFIYEIIWIRMLSMVLGSSTHSFELMLSAFITGLAIGGFWIRNKIDSLKDPVLFAGKIQIIMGLLAATTIVLYNYTYDLMANFLSGLAPTDVGYSLFSTFSHLLCLLVMLPATICAGMTFPLFTSILLKNNYGEKSIGYVYGANTIGSIIGVFFAVFIALPFLGMKFGILLASCIDIVIGLILISYTFKERISFRLLNINFLGSASIIILIILFADIDKYNLASGVYRTGKSSAPEDAEIVYYKDGKTASISVTRLKDETFVIATNGKPDAAINMQEDPEYPSTDEVTMVMAATVPMAMKSNIKQVANIGLGSGLTSQLLLLDPQIENLDTIEIEPAMVEGAKYFLPRVDKVYNDERSHIHIEDAKTFFSIHQKKYDLIISEPSNPWVSGVSSLYTQEFYNTIKNYLTEDGMFVQWVQIYELDIELLFSILTALHQNFPYFDMYSTDNTNILIVARNNDSEFNLSPDILNNEAIKHELEHVGIYSIQDFNTRYLGNEKVFGQYIKKNNTPANSDYFPILDLNAESSRFKSLNSINFTQYRIMPLPFINMMLEGYDHNDATSVKENIFHGIASNFNLAEFIYESLITDKSENEPSIDNNIFIIKHFQKSCIDSENEDIWQNSLFSIMFNTIPYLQPKELKDIIDFVELDCVDSLSDESLQWLALYRAIAERDIVTMEKISYEFLESENDSIGLNKKQFLFFNNILANILQEDHEKAMKIWEGYQPKLFQGSQLAFELTLLYSLINPI